ncbi:MAG: ATP-binding protein [bacterium]
MKTEDKINILLVDDKPENLLALEGILESPETRLIKATSGNKALALVLDYDFALVLLDVQMPEMDGFETASLMRGIGKTKNIPVIFITAISKDEKYIFQGYESGAVDYIFKPVRPEILKSKVQIFLELYKQRKLLERQTLELEQKMTELSAVLLELQTKEKLLHKQAAELRCVNQELKDFAYIVSHDLKAPLRAISSLSEWIVSDYRDKFDEKGREHLELLKGRVKRMHDLIEGILQYSRVGRMQEKKMEVNLDELVPEVIDMLDPPKNIQVDIKNKLPSIQFEKVRIEQVFQNLISNAIKYMDKERGKIRISSAEENGCWKIFIADNGPGIEKKHQDKIFQMFQTLKARDEYESTGIGLALVKKIIEMNGGKIFVESELDRGSTFIITIPK